MRVFKNEIGCEMCFDDKISAEQIDTRLSFMSGNWVEVFE